MMMMSWTWNYSLFFPILVLFVYTLKQKIMFFLSFFCLFSIKLSAVRRGKNKSEEGDGKVGIYNRTKRQKKILLKTKDLCQKWWRNNMYHITCSFFFYRWVLFYWARILMFSQRFYISSRLSCLTVTYEH